MVESDQAARSNAGSGGGGDPLIGKVLNGRFRVLEKLGAGGMGTVYKALQSPLDRVVALKVLNSNYDSKRDPGFQRRFFLEASVTAKLKHPNTITVIDYGKTDDGIYYIAMEYVEGITLAQVLTQEGSLSWNRVLHIAQQIARSLREAHKSGIIHRDLKPANVMICNEETDHDLVKVLDFGLVKSFMPDSLVEAAKTGEITQAGVFLGSPQYMAPEQARNLADPRSDVYSLGVVLYQMLIGRPPFYAEQSIDVIVKHMKEPPQAFGAARPDLDIPGEVEALVMKCLAKKPDDRYQSMDELLEAIRSAALGTGISGAFSGLRTPGPISQSGAHKQLPPGTSGPRSGAHLRTSQSGVRSQPHTSGAHRATPNSGVHKGNSVSMPIDVDEDAHTDADVPVVGGRKLTAVWVSLAVVALSAVVVLAYLLTRPPAPVSTPIPEPVTQVTPPPVTKEPPQQPVQPSGASDIDPAPLTARKVVMVHVTSEPSGALVMVGNNRKGLTPAAFEVEAGPDGNVQEEVTLSLKGYENTNLTAKGSGTEIHVKATLKKRPLAPPPGKSKNPNFKPDPYKPDPYQ